MKTFIVFLLLGISTFCQTFHTLDGIENQQGETILLYRLGSDYYLYNPVMKFNTVTLTEQILMHAFYWGPPGGEQARAVYDFEFFPGSENNFVNTGYEINPDNHFFIARNDSAVAWDLGEHSRIDISKQNPLNVFALAGGIARSFDGGYTYPPDSIIASAGFIALSLADFDDNVFFGVDEELRFAKNGGVVDTNIIFFDRYSKILYDRDSQHMYRLNKSYGGYAFYVSHSQGNAFTWTKSYQSETPLFLTKDDSLNGTLYLAQQNVIYISDNDYGYNFIPYKSLPYRITGLYKKAGTDVLYASTPYRIYKITPDTMIVIRSLPVPPETFDWFPLAVGNRWRYVVTQFDENNVITGIYEEFPKITKDTVMEGNTYFKFEPPLAGKYEFMRIDSTEGKLKTFLNFDTTEVTLYDFIMEPGDTIYFYPANPYSDGYYLFDEDSLSIFNMIRPVRNMAPLWFLPPGYRLVKNLGYYGDSFFEFGGYIRKMEGCVINGVVYGDTTSDVETGTSLPGEYVLNQNYPNPFNPSTRISYSIPEYSSVIIKVFDILGNEIATLFNEEKPTGTYEVTWNAAGLPSGVYFYQLRAGSFIETKKMILMR